MYVHNHWLTRN